MGITLVLVILLIAAIAYWMYRGGTRSQNLAPEVQRSIPGPGKYAFDIVGESNYQNSLEAICGGKKEKSAKHRTEAELHLEDSNPYDNMAVRVEIEGKTVGYFSRNAARSYRDQLKMLGQDHSVCKCKAMIVGGWRKSKLDQGSFGVKLDLPVA